MVDALNGHNRRRTMIILEIPVDSVESALTAAKNGANRLELCASLSEGGLTPSVGFLKMVKRELETVAMKPIPIFCMLRPRGGDDFVYSDIEMEILIHDMESLRMNGADGFVFGSRYRDTHSIQVEQCKRIIECAKGLPVTFHRVFDLMAREQMYETMEAIIGLGFQRVLTSGLRETAEMGLDVITELIAKYGHRIVIMPGGGITTKNAENILQITKCLEFHSSARSPKRSAQNSSILNHRDIDYVNADIVRGLLQVAHSISKEHHR